MGSTSGARAGDKDTVLDVLFKGTILVPVAVMENTADSNTSKGEPMKIIPDRFIDTFGLVVSCALVFDCRGLSFILFVL